MSNVGNRGFGVAGRGPRMTTECACTLADYTSGGTQAPVVDDVVTFSATGDWFVKRPGDGAVSGLGQVTKIDLAPSGADEGRITVEWIDVIRFVELTTDDLTTVTLGQVALTDGADTVANNFDSAASGSKLHVVALSGASGAGTFTVAVLPGIS